MNKKNLFFYIKFTLNLCNKYNKIKVLFLQ